MLIHSKKPAAFKKNIETEMEHGKPQKQAVAIAYKEAGEHKAKGGEVKCAHGGRMHCDMGCYADGGEVDDREIPPIPITGSGYKMKMAEGGDVDELMDGEEEMSDLLVDELMDAIEKKDKRGMKDAIEAIVMECMNKGGM